MVQPWIAVASWRDDVSLKIEEIGGDKKKK
jgi:hypothetical protein